MAPRSSSERLLAWILTGPIGHLVGGLTDLAVMMAAHARARLVTLARERFGANRAP